MDVKQCYMGFVWLFAALTFALSLGVYDGYNLGSGLIVLSLFGLFFLKPNWSVIGKEDLLFAFAFILYTIQMYFAAYVDIGGGLRDLDKPSRYMLAALSLALLLTVSNKKEWLWYGIIVGAIWACGLALYERLYVGMSRVRGGETAITFGNVSMMLGFLCLVSAIFFFTEKKRFWLYLSLLGGICGFIGSILSGSRGGWVAVPFILFFLFWECREVLPGKRLKQVSLIALSVIFLAVAIPQTGVQHRIGSAVSNVTDYIAGKPNTSVGLRFEMWKAAFYMFGSSPIIGVGASQTTAFKQNLAYQGIIHHDAVDYKTAHNDVLEALSKRGVVGLIALALLYLIPLRLFLKKLREHKDNWRVRSYAIGGVLILFCYFDFGFTIAMTFYNIGIMMFAFPLVYFWAAVRWAEREELQKD